MALLYIKIPFTKVRVSIFAIILILSLFYADFSVYTAIIIISAALHEVGHIVFMKAFGVEIYGITILPTGAVIRSNAASLPYSREIAVDAGGIIFNLVSSLAALAANLILHDSYSLFFYFCGTLLAAVNALPIKTLDGGRIATAILSSRLGVDSAQRYVEAISYISFVALTFASLWLLTVTGCNFSLIVLTVYIFICAYAKE